MRGLVLAAAVCAVTTLAAAAPAPAARAAAIDGISDQSLPRWDGAFGSSAFAQQFRETWVAQGHISYARYVLQWNAFANRGEEPYARYAREFEAWWDDVSLLQLTPVVAFYNYCPAQRVPRACTAALPNPPSEAAYRSAIESVLGSFKAAVVEAWNEPNDDEVSEALAARFAGVASEWCAQNGCTTIAGDFLDSRGSASYASRYLADLGATGAPQVTNWGVHPYYALNATSGAREAEAIRDVLRGDAKVTWITEIGAYYCDKGQVVGEAEQRARAQRLVSELAPSLRASHVFYYEFLRGDRERPPCETGGMQEDSALYKPDDSAREAANVIFEGSVPQAPAGVDVGASATLPARASAAGAPQWLWGFGAALG